MKYCCDTMKSQLTYSCSECDGKCPDVVVTIDSKGSYTLWSPNAEYYCYYCPWCGTKKETIC